MRKTRMVASVKKISDSIDIIPTVVPLLFH